MLSHLFHNRTKRDLLIEINPYQILVAGIVRQRREPVTVEFAAEFERDNVAGLRQWIEGNKDLRKRWMTAICGFVSRTGILQRESLRGADLADPIQLITTIRDQQSHRSSASSAPFKQLNAEEWTFRAVNATDGTPLPAEGAARPALLMGLPNRELHGVQQLLLDCRLMPEQLEPSLLPLFGTLYRIMEQRRYPRAPVIFVIRPESTVVYVLGKEGVHTPGPVAHGLTAITQQVRKEFNLASDAEAQRRLQNPDDDMRRRAKKLLRGLATELRPMLDSYEMTTGQPVGDIYCPYLPPALAWLAEQLIRSIDHEPLAIDCHEWMPMAGLQTAPGLPSFGPHWLGALSLAANLGGAGVAADALPGETANLQRPWHVDCRRSIEAPGGRWLGREFLSGAAAVLLMLLAVTLAGWQGYVSRSLQADTRYWEDQMDANRRLVDELTASLRELNGRSDRLKQAHGLMREPYQFTEFIMNLGRVQPPRLRIDRIDANDHRVILTGSLLEPAEDASRSLGRYLEILRRTPGIGEMFDAITATSLQREGGADVLAFEITMRHRPTPTP